MLRDVAYGVRVLQFIVFVWSNSIESVLGMA